MVFIERVNRILVSGLLVLVFIQLALLFFLNSLKDEAQFRLVKNTSKAALVCGEKQFDSENYWPLTNENSADILVSHSECRPGSQTPNDDCANSHLQWTRPSQNKQLHLISITAPPPMGWDAAEPGGVVKVQVKKSAQPQIIALVSRSPLEWNFQIEKGAHIEKIVVATPTTVWLNNVDAKIPIEYLPKEKMCSYPYAWEEVFNPENEFRVLAGALQKITGLELNSFQGAKIGREFSVPLNKVKQVQEVPVRGLASVSAQEVIPAPLLSHPLSPGALIWERKDGHVVAATFKLKSGEVVELPAKTTEALEAGEQLFAVIKGRLNIWSSDKKKFTVIESPMALPKISRISAFTFDSVNARLVIYNDDRSGEFYRYELATQKWQLFKDGFKYHVSSMYFDNDTKNLMILTSRGPYFSSLVTLAEDGKQSLRWLKDRLVHDRKRWHWSLDKVVDSNGANKAMPSQAQSQWQVKIYSPLQLTGEAQALR